MTQTTVATAVADRTCAAESDVGEIAQQRLRDCPYAALRNVQCRFHEGVLVLSGEVPTYYTKQMAQQYLRDLDQVQQIDNRLVVTF